MKEIHNENNIITSSAKKNNHYQNSSNKYSEFYKRKLREKMLKLFKRSNADKSTLPILRLGLKDMDPEIVELSASLIRKFK